jgi:apolipoprotein N-acyltransferase
MDCSRSLLKNAMASVFCGLIAATLFNLAFPGGPLPWIAWISMLPIMILLEREKRPWLVCLGWVTYGIFIWLGAVYWLYVFMKFVLDFNAGFAFLILSLCVLISSVPYILVGYIASRFSLFQGNWGALKLAALLSSFVALWPVPFPGDLSMSFYQIPIFTQIADIGGGHIIHL